MTKLTLIDSSYLGSCPECGAAVMPENRATHSQWHDRTRRALRSRQEGLEALAETVDRLDRHVSGRDSVPEYVFEAHLEGMDCGRRVCRNCGRPDV